MFEECKFHVGLDQSDQFNVFSSVWYIIGLNSLQYMYMDE